MDGVRDHAPSFCATICSISTHVADSDPNEVAGQALHLLSSPRRGTVKLKLRPAVFTLPVSPGGAKGPLHALPAEPPDLGKKTSLV